MINIEMMVFRIRKAKLLDNGEILLPNGKTFDFENDFFFNIWNLKIGA